MIILFFGIWSGNRRQLRGGVVRHLVANTFANSRTAFASLRGKAYPIYRLPLWSA